MSPPITPPRATYRLQFREGMDFDRAAGLAPYLARLGVSHLYASPLFQATAGSTHGYDVTDHGRIEASLGGMEGFLRLSAALKAHGLGLILDIVPNHMAASPENPWWRDVLRHGRESAYAGHFDIDWTAPRLIVPTLGQPYGAALEAGEFALGHDMEGLTGRYYEHAFPLDPRTWGLVLDAAGIALPGGDPAEAPARFADWIAAPQNAERLNRALGAASADRRLLHRVHEAQPWRLVYWRAARDSLTHRRFFEIADLVGVRVEEPRVFDDVHRLLFELVEAGHVHGIRVDHVDGLADPAGYLARLKDRAPGHPPVWVEKILGADEALPEGWPVEGTTGYEFARAVGDLLTDPAGGRPLTEAYEGFIDAAPDPRAMLTQAKREVLTYNLAAELTLLTGLAREAADEDPVARDWGPDTLRRALIAIALAMPVYRTYLDGGAPEPADAAILADVEREATSEAALDDPAAVGDVLRLIRTAPGPAAARLRTRFQQTTGALLAKAMEDTLFYRYHRLLSANEVGGEPEPMGLPGAAFAREISARAESQRHGLNATATHDTKRGEDARMRIAAIADDPAAWASAAEGWERLLGARGMAAPGPAMRWHFYQALLGAWDPADMGALAERMAAYMVKAAREAQRRTSWTRQDDAYEAALTDFVRHALLGEPRFPAAFDKGARPFIAAGARKSLVQLALKLALPGVPDIYQGTEWADLSLVDPDNRRPVDFDARMAALDAADTPGETFDSRKMALLRRLLALRADSPGPFERGSYRRLATPPGAPGRHFGFARAEGDAVLAVLAELSPPPAREQGAPAFALPEEWRALGFRAVHPDVEVAHSGVALAPADGFEASPVLVAVSTGAA